MRHILKNSKKPLSSHEKQKLFSDEESEFSSIKQYPFKRFTALVLILATFCPSSGWCTTKPQDDPENTHQSSLVRLPIPDVSSIDLQQGALIGRGSFGDVYRGKWMGQDIAIKRLHMQSLSTHTIQDFNTETQMMWECQFSNILRLHGVCREPGQTAMVLELMSRGSLFDLLHSPEDIPEKRRWQIAIDVAQGLTDLHRSNILHRDLKSLNILLDESYRAKISDFGLAKLRLATSTTTTQAKPASVGTVRWRAPELFGLRPQTTPALDVYSYGMVLWELASRKKPFEEQPDDQIVISAVKAGEREEIPTHCPPVWCDIITACWKTKPEERPTAAEVLNRLKRARPAHQKPVWLPEEAPSAFASLPASGFMLFPAALQDWQKVLTAYQHHPVPGFDVGRVEVIYNPAMNGRFASSMKLLQERKGNPFYGATWSQKPDAPWRTEIFKHLEAMARPYQDDEHPDVKIMPLWHGTQRDKLQSLLSAGFTPFGTTDDGYFGRGIYAAHEAAYAEMYANKCAPVHNLNGILLFNWGMTYSSFPIVRQDYEPSFQKLTVAIESGKYDSRFIPVVPNPRGQSSADYIPTTPHQAHIYTEVMLSDSAQLLPRYLVTLQSSLSPVMPSGSRAGAHMPFGMTSQGKAIFSTFKQKLEMVEEQERRKLKETLQQEYARVSAVLMEQFKGSRPVPYHGIVTPSIVRGHEDVYRMFLRGKLVYNPGFFKHNIELPIAALANPLDGIFDLSKCGDSGQHLSIATGYRKGKKPENANKLEIWLSLHFLIDNNPTALGSNRQEVMGQWNAAAAPLGIFWTWGDWNNLGRFDYLITHSFEQLSNNNLYEKACMVKNQARWACICTPADALARSQELRKFHLSF